MDVLNSDQVKQRTLLPRNDKGFNTIKSHSKVPCYEWLLSLQKKIYLAELCSLAMLLLYAIMGCIFFREVESAAINITLNLIVTVTLLTLILGEEYFNRVNLKLLILARRFFLLPGLFFIYSQTHLYVTLVNPFEADVLFIQWDRWLFGTSPTQWIYQFTHPLLTEIFQLCYFLYFVIPLGLSIELYLRSKKEGLEKLMYFGFLLSFSFYCSYLLYFIAPAVGPCFTLHNFSTIRQELPGLFFTNTIRDIVDVGWGITYPNPVLTVHRNCMPSGHTMITLVNVVAGFMFASRFRWFYSVVGAGIIISTIYLRYHYVVDLIAGVFCAIIALWLATRLRIWLQNHGFSRA